MRNSDIPGRQIEKAALEKFNEEKNRKEAIKCAVCPFPKAKPNRHKLLIH